MKAIKNLVIIILLLNIGCSDSTNNPSEVIFPDRNVSFTLHVQPFLRYNCSFSGCHSDESQAGGRRMTDYFSLFETANIGLIIAKDTTRSRLIQILDYQNHNPYLRWVFTSNQIKGMKTWVMEGAKLN